MADARNPWSDWFNYVFTYFPTTNWQHAFSPTINFGGNIQDAPIEQHVVDSVGSYGFQLNRVLDALSVVIASPTLDKLSPEDEQKIALFKELATAADDAANEYKGQLTETSVKNLIESMQVLKLHDADLYEKLKTQILASI
jgi:hypothetical protein